MKGVPTKPRRPQPDSLSLHTTPDDYEYGNLPADDLPPSYADSEFAAASSFTIGSSTNPSTQAAQILPEAILTEHSQDDDVYAPLPRDTSLKGRLEPQPISSRETTIRLDKRLDDPYNLYAYIMDYVRAQPPIPVIRVHGYHYEQKTKHHGKPKERESNRVTDFDIEVNLQSLLRPAFDEQMWHERVVEDNENAYRGSFRKTRELGQDQAVYLTDVPTPDLKEWCERYCASKAVWKVFRVHREVDGFDQELLTTKLSEMVRSTDYDGTLEVTFPVYNQNVDIYSPHWTNLWRTSWIHYVFFPTMLWILFWPLLFFYTRWYCVYTVRWLNSTSRPHPANDGRLVKTYATMTERDWLTLHREYLRHLVMQRHQGRAETSQAIEWSNSADHRSRRR